MCTCGKCGHASKQDRKPLAPPQPATLRDIATAIYVHRVLRDLSPTERQNMVDEIERVDGDRIPASKPDLYVAGVYLAVLSRAPTAPKSTKNTDEAEAKAKMRRASSDAWRK
jgi:hypothetical protein